MRRALALSGALWLSVVSTESQAVSPNVSQPRDGTLSPSERKFLDQAAAMHTQAVTTGKYAQDHAFSPGLRRYGQTVAEDHTRALDELKRVASKHGIALAQHKAVEQKSRVNDDVMLARLVGGEQRALRLFSVMERRSSDSLVMEYIEGNVGILKDHVRVGQRLKKTLKSEGRSTPRSLDVDLTPPD